MIFARKKAPFSFADQGFTEVSGGASLVSWGNDNESATVAVDFAEPRETIGENARLEAYQRRMALGIWDVADVMIADNADITSREAAIRTLAERRAEIAALNAPTTTETPTDNSTTGTVFGTPAFGA